MSALQAGNWGILNYNDWGTCCFIIARAGVGDGESARWASGYGFRFDHGLTPHGY